MISTSRLHDTRGFFSEVFRGDLLREARGRDFDVAQMNASQSRRGVLRGIHASASPGGQAKYVTCVSGAILDVIVDLEQGSATYGKWSMLELSGANGRCLFIGPHVGHAFVVTSNVATVVYLTSSVYQPEREFTVNAFDPDLAIQWPRDLPVVRSARDENAPSLVTHRDMSE